MKESTAFRDDVTVNNIGNDMHRSLFRTSYSQDFGPALEPSAPGGLVRSRMEEQCTGIFQTAKKEEWVVSLILIVSN